MKQLQQLKNEYEQKRTDLFKAHGVFFAFSDKQFEENKTPLEPGDKYARFLVGSYLPLSKSASFSKAFVQLESDFYTELMENNLRKELILDELYNHEAFYVGDVDATLEALGPKFTREEVESVFYANQQQAWKAMGW